MFLICSTTCKHSRLYLDTCIISCMNTCNLSRVKLIVHLDFQLNVWIISVGFTLGFGALFSKTFRIHILFTQGAVKKVRLLIECWSFNCRKMITCSPSTGAELHCIVSILRRLDGQQNPHQIYLRFLKILYLFN